MKLFIGLEVSPKVNHGSISFYPLHLDMAYPAWLSLPLWLLLYCPRRSDPPDRCKEGAHIVTVAEVMPRGCLVKREYGLRGEFDLPLQIFAATLFRKVCPLSGIEAA